MTAALVEARPRVGDELEGYEVVGVLGAGGMGEVLRVRRRRIGGFERQLAMKILHPHLAADAACVAMFLDEARLASRVSHRNVVGVTDVGVHRGLPWLVMELLEGLTLHELTGRVELPLSVRLAILAAAAEGLHAAHEATDREGRSLGLVHRDVSPDNLFVGRDGIVKVLDFGIAIARDRMTRTETGELKGKLSYAAPERLEGRAIDPHDRRLDVWSFGVVAWECLAGRRLFEAEDRASRIGAVRAGRVPSLADAAPGTPDDVCTIIHACLAREPDARPASLDVVARVLRGAGAASEEDIARAVRAVDGVARASSETVGATAPDTERPRLERSERRAVLSSPSAGSTRGSARRRWALGAVAAIVAGLGASLWWSRAVSPAQSVPDVPALEVPALEVPALEVPELAPPDIRVLERAGSQLEPSRPPHVEAPVVVVDAGVAALVRAEEPRAERARIARPRAPRRSAADEARPPDEPTTRTEPVVEPPPPEPRAAGSELSDLMTWPYESSP